MPLGEEEFNFEAFDQEFEAEYGNGDEDNDEIIAGDETVLDDEETPPAEDDDTLPPNEEDDLAPPPPSRDENQSKHDTAFAQLRRERDEANKLASWIKAMAEENGTTPEEMRQRYEEAKLAKNAEKAGVPVEFLQKQTQTDNELQAIKEQLFNAQFDASVNAVIEKYEASEEDIQKTFAYARDEGLAEAVRAGAISFDALHRLAHLETFTEKKVQSALQDNLAKKKKRQLEAPIGNGSSATDVGDDIDALAEEDAKKALLDW